MPDLKDIYEAAQWSDIVHTTTYTAAPKALKAARKFNKPCLVTVYEALGEKWFWVEGSYLKAFLFFCFERYVLKKKFSLYHVISRATRADLTDCGIPSELITKRPTAVKRRIQSATERGRLSGSRPRRRQFEGLPFLRKAGEDKGHFHFIRRH